MTNLILFPLAVASDLFKAFVLMKLWGWLAVPIFGYAPLGFPQAVAVMILVAAFFRTAPDPRIADTRTEEEKIRANWVLAISQAILYAIFLGAGALLTYVI